MNKTQHPAESILAALGLVTYSWSSLQRAMEYTVWTLLNLDGKRGRIITSQITTAALIDMMQTCLNEAATNNKDHQALTKNFVEHLRSLNSKRNEVMHSYWRMPKGELEISTMFSSRQSAKGKLRKDDKQWTKDELYNLSREIVVAQGTLIDFCVTLRNRAKDASGD